MNKSTLVDQEEFKDLSSKFPNAPPDLISNYLKLFSYDDALFNLQTFYPQNDNSNEQNYHDDEQIPLNSISSTEIDEKISYILQEYPNFDIEICLVLLEDSDYDTEKAIKKATAICKLQQDYEDSNRKSIFQALKAKFPKEDDTILLNAIEFSQNDFSKAVSFILDNTQLPKVEQNPSKKQKKEVLDSNGEKIIKTPSNKHKKEKRKSQYIQNLINNGKQKTDKIPSPINQSSSNTDEIPKNDFNISPFFQQYDNQNDKISLNKEQNNSNDPIVDQTTLNSNLNAFQIDHKISKENQNEKNSVKNDENNSNDFNENETSLNVNMTESGTNQAEYNNSKGKNLENQNKSKKSSLFYSEDDDDDEEIIFYKDKVSSVSSSSKFSVNKTTKMPERYLKLPESATIDLHGMSADQATEKVNRELDAAKSNNFVSICFITGVGKNSKGNVPILRPLVMSICKKRGFHPILSKNKGYIIVNFN